ncbi:MAG TPA: hypothetical protein VGO58_08245 [Chitinophagaceae bacterium]|nr:hypothetical protein [Chitinophagaceae bacterium]
MKKLSITAILLTIAMISFSQDSTGRKSSKEDKKEARRQKINTLIKQSEEGVLIYRKQTIFGVQGRTNGYGLFYELGKMKTNRKTMTYRIDLTEIKHQKEEKLQNSNGPIPFGNPYVYGKINNFYQFTLGIGQQHILGQKGNKNGVAVSAVFNAGLAIGLLRPYYVELKDPVADKKFIRYSKADSLTFLGAGVLGSAGIGKGWNEIKMKPGGFVKSAVRFDYGRFNEVVSGIEVGVSVEFYGSKIPIMVAQKEKQLFFQGYIALLFGKRK